MAKNLNYLVVAEGVETIEQFTFLQGLDCDQMQGYLFSKPLPVDEITDVLVKLKL
jgi:EAL domain-containing protein (putative c-di-GMP-specific phosphodiesterase class I)